MFFPKSYEIKGKGRVMEKTKTIEKSVGLLQLLSTMFCGVSVVSVKFKGSAASQFKDKHLHLLKTAVMYINTVCKCAFEPQLHSTGVMKIFLPNAFV